jgi:hypothetical protein
MKIAPATLLSLLEYLEPILCALVIWFILRGKAARQFAFLFALMSVRLVCSFICLSLLYVSAHFGIERHIAYQLYFYVYWSSYALEAILSLLVIYSIFKLAMAPLKGLQTLGMLVFRWVAAISVAPLRYQFHGCHDYAAAANFEHPHTMPAVVCLLCDSSDGSLLSEPNLRSKPWTWLSRGHQSRQLRMDCPQRKHVLHVQCDQRGRSWPYSADLVGLLRVSRAEAPHHHSPHHIAVPSLESDFDGSGRRSWTCGGWRNPTGALCTG